MRDDKKTELKVGITVFLALVVLLWILGWAKNTTFFPETNVLKIRFDSVAGLSVGDGVYINGLKKGIVEAIKLDNDKILVDVSFTEDLKIKKDASFSVMMLDLMGGKKIEINPGVSNDLMDFKEVQTGKFAGDISSTMAVLGSVQDELVTIIKDVKISLNSINAYLTDADMKDDIKSTIKSIHLLISKVTLLVDNNKTDLHLLLTNSNNLVTKANSFIDNNEPQIKSTLTNLNTLLKSSDSLVAKFDKLAVETKEKKNNIGKFIYDETMYNKLVETIAKLNDMINILNEQLKGDGLNVDLF